MFRPARLAALVACLALTVSSMPAAQAYPDPSPRPQAGQIAKLKWPGHSLVHGTRGVVKGKVPGRKRVVVLEQLVPNRGWVRVDRDRTNKKGKFKLKVPTSWYHTKIAHRVRPIGSRPSKSYGVAVKPPYVPVGKKSHWSPIDKKVRYQYNPCRTINWRSNTTIAQPGALDHLKEAIRRLEVASGLNFKYKGSTKNQASNHKKWPKNTNLVVVWHTEASAPVKLDGFAGKAGPLWARWMVGNGGRRVAATLKSRVLMNADEPVPPGFTGSSLGLVLMHELGHATGLGHVLQHPGQVMSYQQLNDWQAGDLTGLRKLGKQSGCLRPFRGRGRLAADSFIGPEPIG